MPDEHADPQKVNMAEMQGQDTLNLPQTLPRISFKTGLIVYLSAGLLFFLLSQLHYLIFHSLVEFVSIVLLTTVFLIGWNTRHLVRSQFFLVLAVGLLASGMVDFLHTLAYKGMHHLPYADANTATQLWLAARTLVAMAFLCSLFSLGRKDILSPRGWLLGFMTFTLIMVLLVWPLKLFPMALIEGQGLTKFKINYEYILIALFAFSACLLLFKQRYLNRFLNKLLLMSLVMGILSELMFTLYVDVYDFVNFLGHYFKFGSVGFVYFALVEGTLRAPFTNLFRDMTESYEELNRELQKRVTAEKQQEIAHRDASILYRMSRVMHSTLNLDELAHLILSAVTSSRAGGFDRATLFTVNRRTGTLQGMLGVSQDMASLVLPEGEDDQAWENLHLDEASREKQRTSLYNQKVVKQRLSLEPDDNALAQAFHKKRVALITESNDQFPGGKQLREALDLSDYACAPLAGRDQVMGILVVDNAISRREINPNSMRFLELFASQAGSALDNAGLVKRLEMAHDNLQEVQEQLIHGEKMAVLGEMAAQVAHELRNPLVSIGGFAQRLNRTDLQDDKANEYAGIIAREVRRMEDLLGNILSFSKKQLVCLEDCDISSVLHEAVEMEFDSCQKAGVEIANQFETLPEIVGDYRQLRQVFQNLLINARQAIHGDGKITVRSRRGTLRGDEAVVVEIEDTGGGISPEVMRNMFNPFFSTSPKGTGLGLSISHRIVAHHNGSIEIVNAEKGARFIVRLPVVQPGPVNIENKEPTSQQR